MGNAVSVVTIPLKTEKWQEDCLDKRFELCRKVYNNMLSYEIKQWQKMTHDHRYMESKKVIDDTYRISDEKEKKQAKKSDTYKEAAQMQKELLMEYGFSEFAFTNKVLEFQRVYSQNVSSTVATRSIAKPMWAAFEKKLFGNGQTVHFKRYGDFTSIASDGRSGIRMVNDKNRTVLERDGDEKLFVMVSNPGNKKTLKIPLIIKKNDTYKQEMLSRKIRVVRITRKMVKGTYRYSVQLTVDGLPAIRFNKETGEIKNTVGTGKAGVYIDTESVTIAKADGTFEVIDLSSGIPDYSKEIAALQQYMENSRRISNPENYNADGTIKKGTVENGRRTKLKWTFSKGYEKAKIRLSELYRVQKENRTLQRHRVANYIISCGDTIIINDYPFEYMHRKKAFPEGEESKSNGSPKKKKRDTAANIQMNAPALLVTLTEQKLLSRGGQGVVKVKLKDMDYSEGYRKYYAKKLLEEAA